MGIGEGEGEGEGEDDGEEENDIQLEEEEGDEIPSKDAKSSNKKGVSNLRSSSEDNLAK